MKVSREQAAENRERIVDVAATLFRERGFDGIGVADLMKNAGMTHGGFYGHFASKEALMAQACTRAFAALVDNWKRLIARNSDAPLPALVASSMSARHRDHAGQGCVLSALGADAARQGPEVREAVTAGVQAQIDVLAGLMPGKSAAARREKALTTYASLVGAMLISRAVNDPALSDELLQTTAAALTQQTAAKR